MRTLIVILLVLALPFLVAAAGDAPSGVDVIPPWVQAVLLPMVYLEVRHMRRAFDQIAAERRTAPGDPPPDVGKA